MPETGLGKTNPLRDRDGVVGANTGGVAWCVLAVGGSQMMQQSQGSVGAAHDRGWVQSGMVGTQQLHRRSRGRVG